MKNEILISVKIQVNLKGNNYNGTGKLVQTRSMPEPEN